MKYFSNLMWRIRHSLALELLTVVSTYLLIAVGVTVIHVIITYNSTKSQIEKSIDSVWNITRAGLSRAVWELDREQVRAILTGILESPLVTGVKVIDRRGQLVEGVGVIKGERQQYRNMSASSRGQIVSRTGLILYEQKYPVHITEFRRFNELGEIMIYSSNEIIFEEVKFDILLILLNAVIKTIALWGIFLWFSEFILNKPLNLLTQAARKIDMDNLDDFSLPEFKHGNNELGVLRQTFLKMVEKMMVARDALKEVNKQLESKVRERTTRLNRSNYQLTLKNDMLEDQHNRLKEAQSQLIQAEKMSGLGILVAGIAHEINNPTNFINGSIKLIQKEVDQLFSFIIEMAGGADADEEVIAAFRSRFDKINIYLEDSLDGSQRIISIIGDLRSFSRADQEEMNCCNIQDGLESTLRIVQARYKNDVSFVTDFVPLPQITCWPAKLNQVFMNIMLNGCQAILARTDRPEHGTLKVSTDYVDDWIRLTFADNGTGMDQETMGRMFDPFYSTKPVGEGTGLGMSISYGIIKNHNGEIEVSSKPGEGTRITIAIPAKGALIVDDNNDVE